MLPLRILVRSNTAWKQMTAATFAAQHERWLPTPYIRDASAHRLFEAWNQVFPVDFFAYRAQAKDIARKSFDAAGANRLTMGFVDFLSWYKRDEDEIITPIDDDDFYSPRLRDLTAAFDPTTDIVIWNLTRVGFLDGAPTRSCQFMPVPLLGPNNWAVRKSFLRRSFTDEEAVQVLAHHVSGNDMIAGKLQLPDWTPTVMGMTFLVHPRVRFVDDFFSVYNAHPGSIAFLVDVLVTPGDPAGKLAALDLGSRTFVPEPARSLEPYVRALEGLLVRRPSPT